MNARTSSSGKRGRGMTYIAKPKLHHPGAAEPTSSASPIATTKGRISTLCAGCGHDSISAALIQACFELDIEPHRVAKLSGIGCSSKTPDYLLGHSHGFNSVHGRMPTVLTGANLANRDLIYLGVSGDGDSRVDRARPVRPLRAARRQHGLYLREQRRLRPDQGPVLRHRRQGLEDRKAGGTNSDSPIDLVSLALVLGATFVARSFSGDKHQLVPLHQGRDRAQGAAIIDVISPCVQFNNHAGSTKSFDYRARAQRSGEPPRLHPAARARSPSITSRARSRR